MSVYVFLGSTLSRRDAIGELEAIYLPPAAEGDVYRAALARPSIIGIIDGYFDHTPSVRHKEILWAMSQGIHVYGGASMGALRAAELAPFGMVGVGEIYEAYQAGVIEDDDEVAVIHGPAQKGYPELSEALVNIRATVMAAVAARVLSRSTGEALQQIAKETYYPERTYPSLLRRCAERGLDAEELRHFERWVPNGHVNQKRLDALATLRAMRAFLDDAPAPMRVSYSFEHTVYWDRTMASASAASAAEADYPEPLTTELLLEELRLGGAAYARALHDSRLRHLAIQEAQRRGPLADEGIIEQMTERFRRAHGLLNEQSLRHWIEENDLTPEQFAALVREEAALQLLYCHLDGGALRHLPDHLRITGAYGRLRARSLDKLRTLESHGLRNPSLKVAGITTEELYSWYFRRQKLPLTTDVRRYANLAGFGDENALFRAVLREFCYVRIKELAGTVPTLGRERTGT